jgi:hypothetical protein
MGLPADYIRDVIEPLQAGAIPKTMILGALMDYLGYRCCDLFWRCFRLLYLGGVRLITARGMGVDEETIAMFEAAANKNHERRKVLVVAQRWFVGSFLLSFGQQTRNMQKTKLHARFGTDAFSQLQDGDIIVNIDGQLVMTHREVHLALRGKEKVDVTLFRNGRKLTAPVTVFDAAGTHPLGIDDVVLLSGAGWWALFARAGICLTLKSAVVQRPPPYVAWSTGMPAEGCYVSAVYQGSSADTVLPPGVLITDVDDTPTPTLDALSRSVQGKPDGARLRVKVLTPKGKVSCRSLSLECAVACRGQSSRIRFQTHVVALRLDQMFWPAARLQMDASSTRWTRHNLSSR